MQIGDGSTLLHRTVPVRLANLTATVITVPLVIRRSTAPSKQKGSSIQTIRIINILTSSGLSREAQIPPGEVICPAKIQIHHICF